MMTPRFAVHPHLDLDAAACLAAVNAFWAEVELVPSQEVEPRPGLRYLDHPAGEKGRLDPDGRRHAAACAMPETKEWPPDLLAEIDEQDSTGRVLRPRFSLAAVLAGVRAELAAEGLSGADADHAVYDLMRYTIRGLARLGREQEWADRMAASVPLEQVGPLLFALPHGDTGPSVGMALGRRGCVGAIYAEGFNLGVCRYPGQTAPDLRALEPHLPGWFIHTAGFLAAWGSRKAPRTTLPPPGTPQTQHELLELLRRVFT